MFAKTFFNVMYNGHWHCSTNSWTCVQQNEKKNVKGRIFCFKREIFWQCPYQTVHLTYIYIFKIHICKCITYIFLKSDKSLKIHFRAQGIIDHYFKMK